MSVRLQVVVGDQELAEIRAVAAKNGVTVSAWVRQAIRAARRTETDIAPSRKLEVLRRAGEHAFPTGDIETMLAETELGYLRDHPE